MGDTDDELEIEEQVADPAVPDLKDAADDLVQRAASESAITPMTQMSMKSSQIDDGRYRLPKFLQRQNDVQLKQNDMYTMPGLDFSQTDLRKRKRGVIDQLSIFAPMPHEKDKMAPAAELKMDRPVTPIDKEIKTQPLDWDQMAKYVRRRLASSDKLAHMSVQEQQDLAAILVGEVYHIWPDIKRQIDDPFLTPEQNKELNRRIAVHIVTVCEELYAHYLKKAQILNKRGIFSGPANMSRLKAQLGQESGKFLNVLIIRRYIVADMRGKLPELESVDDEYQRHFARKPAVPAPPIPRLSFKGMLKLSRPRAHDRGHHYKTAEEHLEELHEAMPDLDTAKLVPVVAQMPREMLYPERLDGDTSEDVEQRKKKGRTEGTDDQSSSDDLPMHSTGLKKSNSLPELSHAENLLEELDLDTADSKGQKTSASLRRSLQMEGGVLAKSTPKEGNSERLMSELIAADLKRLTAVQREPVYQGSADDDDMPPLLQAILRNAKHDKKPAEYKAKIAELEAKEQAHAAEQSKPLQKSEHPQPTTVSRLLPSNVVVRTSDIRVSERMCSEVITIRQNSTVYNELLDEIDSQTIKRLDSNLFLNQEIKEVYSEIMKTVPKDHLELEQDELVEAAPLKLDTQGLLASATLTKKKASDRMINPQLVKSHRSPWGSHPRADWEKTPLNPPRDSKGVPYFDPLAPSSANIAFANNPMTAFGGGLSLADLPQMVAERMTRSYAAWLTWWKGTIDGDDYKKYVALQETDFLGTVFHMYNDDAEQDSGTSSEALPPKMELLAKELEERKADRLKQMRDQKKQYTPGEWNVQAVMLGGLGRDPDLQDDEVTTKIKTAMRQEVQEAQNKKKLLGDIIKERANAGRHQSMGSSTAELSVPPTRVSFRSTSQSKGDSQTETRAESSAISAASKTLSAQARLEKVWGSLHMTDSLKLDMAIKYSSDGYAEILEQAIAAWELAAQCVVERENVMAELEAFERLASDPNRFFEFGYRGSSAARLDEARIRSRLYKRLEDMVPTIKRAVEHVKQHFGDVITYRGRPYLDKMRSDRVEMLYWLQEERKQLAIDDHRRHGSSGGGALLDQQQRQQQRSVAAAVLPALQLVSALPDR